MTDSIIREFVIEQRELLDLELQAETEQDIGGKNANNNSNNKNSKVEEQRASHILGNLEASGVSVGLYGRTVVEMTLWSEMTTPVEQKSNNTELLLPAHRFKVGDEVEVRAKNKSKKGGYPGGVISAVSDTYVSVALFQDRYHNNNNNNNKGGGKATKSNDNNDDDDENENDGLNQPPLSLVPKSSAEVHRKLLQPLETLAKQGTDHPIAGRIIQAMFHANNHDNDAPSPKISKPTTPIQPFNTNLDQSQLEAISFALQDSNRCISLIHGPPGTGKTTTVAELVHQAVHVHGMKVLVTAPSNVAVDNILERLVLPTTSSTITTTTTTTTATTLLTQKQKGNNRNASKTRALRAVRLGHPARIKSSILSYSLEALVQNADGTEIVADVRNELQSFLRVLSNPRSRPGDKRIAYREIKSLRKEVRTREEKVVRELISSAQVVLATTVGAANRILQKVEGGFDLVVIDEAAQALEASCWIPILRGKRVVLAGDHCQLPPTIKTKHRRAQIGLAKTMFERLMQLYGDDDDKHKTDQTKPPRISRMLKVQYRMHQDIANWASQAMYGGELLTHESIKGQNLKQLEAVQKACSEGGADEDLAETTMLLVDTAGCDMHETVNAAGSRFNQGEANIVVQHVRRLLGLGLQQNQLAIITPYNGQVELLRSMLLVDFPKLEIRSVDGFQGGEREAVVLSLVRSSDRGGKDGIGFLRDDRRQNVGVTRAKRHLAVICDSDTVSQSKFIGTLISWIEEHGEQRSAMEYLSDSANNSTGYEKDLRNAEMELLKLVESSFVEADKGKGLTAKKVAPKSEHKKLDEEKRKALMDKISSFAENGSNGEEMALSTELSSFDRRLVHEFAEQAGLGHRSEGVDGLDRKIILTIQAQEPATIVPKKLVEVKSAEPPSSQAVVSSFSALALDDSDTDEEPEPSTTTASAQAESALPGNSMLAQLAKERAERGKQHTTASKTAASTAAAASNKKKKKKSKGQKVGGAKKEVPKAEDNFDDLDDMAFLDSQIGKAQNTHGRKVGGSGNNYRTIVNGILNSSPAPRAKPTDSRAAAALKSKLSGAQTARKAKNNKKKK